MARASRRTFVSVLVANAAGALLGGATALAREEERPPAGMKARVFEIKHQEPDNLVHALRPLMSGTKGSMINDSDSLRIITVRDFPENLAAIEQALRRLDVPSPPKPDVELNIRVLLGSPVAGPNQIPNDLEKVIRQLNATLNYKSYHQVAAVSQRVRAGSGAHGRGDVQILPPALEDRVTARLSHSIENITFPPPEAGGGQRVQLKKFRCELEGDRLGEANVNTSLSLREGEHTVLGNANLKDRAMIVVLSVRLLK